MDRTVNKAKNFEAARGWDVKQNAEMSRPDRMRAAKILKERAFPKPAKDVREWHRTK